MPTIARLLLAAGAAACFTGCATVSGTVPAEQPQVPSGAMHGGAASVDITPLPGYPLGGHSLAARHSRGYWVRLQARSVYLEDPAGNQLALIAADLWSIPAGLADRVAELLGSARADCRVHRGSIVLAATHTHQSPGNFATSVAYNVLAQPAPGFDPDLFEFLAGRIAMSLEQACVARVPVQLSYGRGVVERLVRNRSIEAFLRNKEEAQALLQENAGLPDGVPNDAYSHPDVYRAVDPNLRVLRIVTQKTPERLVAVAAFAALHPTSLSHNMTIYSGDLFGIAAQWAETALGAPVVVFNGPQADISPAWAVQNRSETVRLGRLLADRIVALAAKTDPMEGGIQRRYAIRQLAGGCYAANESPPRCTDDSAVPGVAVLGGAEDGTTEWASKGWREGITGYYNANQGAKHSAFDLSFNADYPPLGFTWLAKLLLRPPEVVPLGVYRLGPLLVATLPGEFSTVAGRRIRNTLRAVDPAVSDVLLVGLANEYVSYFATPEEYSAQHYEGASTLYGPESVPLIQAELHALALQPPGDRGDARDFDYRVGLVRHFQPQDALSDKPHGYPFADIEVDTSTGEDVSELLPRYCWRDVPRTMRQALQDRLSTTPSVRVEQGQEWHVVDSDDRAGVLVYLQSANAAETCWCASWLEHAASRISAPNARFRFVVTALDGTRRISDEFLEPLKHAVCVSGPGGGR